MLFSQLYVNDFRIFVTKYQEGKIGTCREVASSNFTLPNFYIEIAFETTHTYIAEAA